MKNRLGMTIVEILVVSGLLMLIIAKIIDIGVSGQEIMDESSKLISLQNGVRAVLENMVQDINSSMAIVNPGETQLTLARFKGAVDDELIAMNTSDVNPAFPYFMDGQRTGVFYPVLFVEYQISDPSNPNLISLIQGREGAISRVAKTGTLKAEDSPEGVPYFIDYYEAVGDLTLKSKKVLANKVTKLGLDYYAYDQINGQIKPVGDLGTAAQNNERISMVHVHLAAEDPYERKNRRTPSVEIATKIWSFRKIQENKYSEYFGHTDRDLTF
tara:strand:- start:129 stop:941 length:813 start_codon:yes stop_codon:yes gene_type:complete